MQSLGEVKAFATRRMRYSLSFTPGAGFLFSFILLQFYALYQVFLDVVESVNILVNSNGQVVRSDVVGALKMRTYLR